MIENFLKFNQFVLKISVNYTFLHFNFEASTGQLVLSVSCKKSNEIPFFVKAASAASMVFFEGLRLLERIQTNLASMTRGGKLLHEKTTA